MRTPLNPWVYLVRNSGKSLPLVAVIMLAVILIAGIVALVNSIPFSVRQTYSYARHQLAIMPRAQFAVDPKILDRLAKSPVRVDRVVRCRVIGTQVRSIVGKWPFVVVCLKPKDVDYFLEKMHGRGVDGRLPVSGAPEAVISEPVARNLNLRLGSVLLSPNLKDSYSPKHVKVVGISRSPEWFMISSYDYHAKHHFPPYDNILVFAGSERDQALFDTWAVKAFKGEDVELFSYAMLEKSTREMFSILYKILNVIIGTLVLVLTLLMGMLMNIYQSQRLVEFGLLEAIGYTRKSMLRRVIAESVIVTVLGWLLGGATAYGLLTAVDRMLMHPNAFAMNTWDPAAFAYTAVIPMAIFLAAVLTVVVRFRRFDPVAIVERRLA